MSVFQVLRLDLGVRLAGQRDGFDFLSLPSVGSAARGLKAKNRAAEGKGCQSPSAKQSQNSSEEPPVSHTTYRQKL